MRAHTVELKITVSVDATDRQDAISRAKEAIMSGEFDLDEHAEVLTVDTEQDGEDRYR